VNASRVCIVMTLALRDNGLRVEGRERPEGGPFDGRILIGPRLDPERNGLLNSRGASSQELSRLVGFWVFQFEASPGVTLGPNEALAAHEPFRSGLYPSRFKP
jgi:hypothetical protein